MSVYKIQSWRIKSNSDVAITSEFNELLRILVVI